MWPRQRLIRMPIAIALVVTLFACRAEEQTEGDVPRSEDGPLSVGDLMGGQSFLPPTPRPSRWWASTGSFGLCTSGSPVELETVRLDGVDHPPHEAWLLTDVPENDQNFVTFGSTVGRPPDFDEDYAGPRIEGGTYTPMKGATINDPCPKRSVVEGVTELVLATQADREGAEIPGFWIDYSVAGRPYTLHVDWTIVLCGDRPDERCGS